MVLVWFIVAVVIVHVTKCDIISSYSNIKIWNLFGDFDLVSLCVCLLCLLITILPICSDDILFCKNKIYYSNAKYKHFK